MTSALKKIFIVLLLLISSGAYSQQYWLSKNSPVTLDLIESHFLDSLTGWVCGDSGLIMKTTNGGNNWIFQNSKVKDAVHEIFFLNSRLGWALSMNILNPQPPYGTTILKTTDGGNNWDTTRFPIENVFFRAVYFQDSLHGFIGGVTKNIMRTTDGGAHWLDVYIDTLLVAWLPVNHFDFFSSDYGYATGGRTDFAGVVWRTTDRGVSWYPTLVSPEPTLNTHFLDSLRIICITGDWDYGPSMISSTNSGGTWKYTYLGFFGQPYQMSYRTANEVWTPLGFGLKFIYSLDSGFSWRETMTPDSSEVDNVIFTDSMHGYAFGKKGKMYKYNTALIGVSNPGSQVPDKFSLEQNFPNPFNPSTNISYELKSPSYVTLRVFDITGKEIRTLVNGFQNRGVYKLRFHGDGLPSGIYFYEIAVKDISGNTGGFIKETKKMALIK
ncbi:MAG: YCF48-related protein [Bacteroidetes bacterium]|nr:YCF48-related protein [Bacteroidota bacterium]